MSRESIIGAIIAGGQNTRYGALKALETVGSVRILDRVVRALQSVTPSMIMIANEPAAYADAGLPMRGDVVPGLGALSGIHSALMWAGELEAHGVLAVACDMPFLDAGLLNTILETARASGADVVAPESGGRRGIEPLCAYYGTACLPAIESAIARGDQRMIGFHADVVVARIPLARVEQYGDPETLFMNVNTREERDRAERIAASRHD